MKILILIAIAAFTGCASSSGVIPSGQDTFMISKQAGTGFAGLGTMKTDAIQEGNEYCIKHKKQFQVVRTSESAPPYVLGNFPRAEIEFRCLSAGDPELARPNLVPVPNNVIEIRQPGSAH